MTHHLARAGARPALLIILLGLACTLAGGAQAQSRSSDHAAVGGLTPAGSFHFLTPPVRFIDTRTTGGAFTNGEVRAYNFNALQPSVIPADARGVTGNVAVVPRGNGNLQSSPSGAFAANSPSFINFVAGTNLSNHFASALDSSGNFYLKANVFTGTDVHVIIDVFGYYQ